ncbi:thiol:disulfide interchange protein DsbA/DsbL [Massilia putida]|uniref:thiol:disulfide interchange protein DsbA/DsbL n=1 Tax=Massilia putida TaxID=1141883 RepID=UPI000952FE79|nr:thiol:disulfide interchange protein DsbA/DsbL [Massilia putida]
MRLPRRLFCTALLGLAAGFNAASALAADPQAGAQYVVLPVPQPTDTGKKVEVIEFFAYYCPHCYAFEPALEAWVKKQGDNIVFKRVHVPRDASVLPQQRLFYTLDAMGLLSQYHQKVFDAMHQQHLRLSSDEQVFDWVAQNGIDRAKFIDTYRSFGIQAKLRRASAMMEAYGVDRWPLVVIDGRFITSPSHAGAGAPEGTTEAQQQQTALQAMDFLVTKAKADKR